ncbi:MAG: hypothetical protein R2778_09865 [Saprospiraceae bacterium]
MRSSYSAPPPTGYNQNTVAGEGAGNQRNTVAVSLAYGHLNREENRGPTNNPYPSPDNTPFATASIF